MKIIFLVDKEQNVLDQATALHIDTTHVSWGPALWQQFSQWFVAHTGKFPVTGKTAYGTMCELLAKTWLYASGGALRFDYPLAHLHPEYQTQWLRLLTQIPSIQTVYILTSSPVLINCVGYLIALGNLKVEQASVCVFSGDTMHEYRYDGDGFLVDWPLGYFIPSYVAH